MPRATISDNTITISTPDIASTITYPFTWMAITAYKSARESCERFSKEPDLTPNSEPKIYVFGEMCTWQQYLKRFLLTAEKIGAVVHVKNLN